MPPFVTFYTPTYKRPKALARCKESVANQTCQDLQHLIIVDDEGLGIGGMYKAIPEHAHKVKGSYVNVLSDDDILQDSDVVQELKDFASLAMPEVIIWTKDRAGRALPDKWPPTRCHIDLGCWVVRTDVWLQHKHAWGDDYAGDYDFISAVWDAGHDFVVMNRHAMTAQRISNGEPE